jgi:hypothetical protein
MTCWLSRENRDMAAEQDAKKVVLVIAFVIVFDGFVRKLN